MTNQDILEKAIKDEDILKVAKWIDEAPVPTAMRWGIDKDGKKVVQFTDYKSEPVVCEQENLD